jgi:hypothetical protein
VREGERNLTFSFVCIKTLCSIDATIKCNHKTITKNEKIMSDKPNYKIPEKYKRTLKKGEFAIYRMVGTGYNEDGKFSGRDLILPPTDIIQDEDGTIIPIAYVESWRSNGDPIFGSIQFRTTDACQLILRHGARDAAAYNHLEICNFNGSNKNRDVLAPIEFERVDTMGGSRESRQERKLKRAAQDLAMDLTDEELVNFVQTNMVKIDGLRVVNKPDGSFDYEEMRDVVERLAEQKPQKFMSLHVAVAKPVSTTDQLVNYAVENDIVKFDKEVKSWFNVTSGKNFLKVGSIKNGIPKKELGIWLTSAAGKGIRDIINAAKEAEVEVEA